MSVVRAAPQVVLQMLEETYELVNGGRLLTVEQGVERMLSEAARTLLTATTGLAASARTEAHGRGSRPVAHGYVTRIAGTPCRPSVGQMVSAAVISDPGFGLIRTGTPTEA